MNADGIWHAFDAVNTEGFWFGVAFVLIVVGLALYSRRRARSVDALSAKAKTEAPKVADPEMDQTFAAKLDQQARDKGAV